MMLLCKVLLVSFLGFAFPIQAQRIVQFSSQDGVSSGTIFWDEDSGFVPKWGIQDDSGVAFAAYSDATNHRSFFGSLTVKTNPSYDWNKQMYAAGYLEGWLTADRIYEHYTNIHGWILSELKEDSVPEKFPRFFHKQEEYSKAKVAENPDSFYWRHVGGLHHQLQGLVDGYNNNTLASVKPLSKYDLQELNAVGDFIDLIPALHETARPQWHSMSKEERWRKLSLMGHCSALIKVTGDFDNLFAAHSSWFTYGAMLRVFKHYSFGVSSASQSFSSYPGLLSSLDDFYMMDSGLMMTQTTNPVLNMSLYDDVHFESLWAWQRVRLANELSSSGKQWGEIFSRENSGTYNNQYMIIDHKLFTRYKSLPPNLLWVVEQIPGHVVYEDMTQTLERGYWPSYNVPYFKSIYDASGFPDFINAYGDSFLSGIDYQTAPRALIFRRDQGNVTDLDSLKYIMRYNDYTNDPYAKGDPMAAICSRGDIKGNDAGGCYDTKVTDLEGMRQLVAEAINGPTTNGVPPFRWTEAFSQVSHIGQPDVYDFEFEEFPAPSY